MRDREIAISPGEISNALLTFGDESTLSYHIKEPEAHPTERLPR